MKKSYHKFAFLYSSVSFLLLGLIIVGIKKLEQMDSDVETSSVTNFNFKKIKSAPKKIEEKKIVRKKRMKKKLRDLRPKLSAKLKGQSFGLDISGVEEISIDEELLSSNEDIIMDENSVDSRPEILTRPHFEFPEKALQDNILKGLVEIRMLIDTGGKVKNLEVLNSRPTGYFEEITLAMVKEWTFRPAQYRGKNVAVWAKQVVRFGE